VKVRRIAHSLEALEEDGACASLAAMTSRQFQNRPSTAEADRDSLISMVRRERAGRAHAERAVHRLQAKVSELEREVEEKTFAMEDLTEDLGVVKHALRDRTDAAKLAERDLRMQGIIFRTQSEQQQAACDELARRLVITREDFSGRRSQVSDSGHVPQEVSARSTGELANALPAFRDTLWQLLSTGGQTSWTPRAAAAPDSISLTQQELLAAAASTQPSGLECAGVGEPSGAPTPVALFANIPALSKAAASEVSTAAPTSLVAALPASDVSCSEAPVKVVDGSGAVPQVQMSGRSLHTDRSGTSIEDEALVSAAANVAKAATLAAADSATKAALSGSDFHEVSAPSAADAQTNCEATDVKTSAPGLCPNQTAQDSAAGSSRECIVPALQAIAEEESHELHDALEPDAGNVQLRVMAGMQQPSPQFAKQAPVEEEVLSTCEATAHHHQQGSELASHEEQLELEGLCYPAAEVNPPNRPREGHRTLLADLLDSAGDVPVEEALASQCAERPTLSSGAAHEQDEEARVRSTDEVSHEEQLELECPPAEVNPPTKPDEGQSTLLVEQDLASQDAEQAGVPSAAEQEEEVLEQITDEAAPSPGGRHTVARKALFQKPPKVVPLESWFQLLPQKAGKLDSPKCSEWSEDSSDISDLFMVAKPDEPKVKKQKIGSLVRSSTDEILLSKPDEEQASEHAASDHEDGSSGSETESDDDEDEEEEAEEEESEGEVEERSVTAQVATKSQGRERTSATKSSDHSGRSRDGDDKAEKAGLQGKLPVKGHLYEEATDRSNEVAPARAPVAAGRSHGVDTLQGNSLPRPAGSREMAEACETKPVAPVRPVAVAPPPPSGRGADAVAATIRGAVASSRSSGSARADAVPRSTSVAELPRLKPGSQLPQLQRVVQDAGLQRAEPNWDGRLVYPFEAFKYVRADRGPVGASSKAPPCERGVPVKMKSKLNALSGIYNPLSANGAGDNRDRERHLPKVRSLPAIAASRSPYAAPQRVR